MLNIRFLFPSLECQLIRNLVEVTIFNAPRSSEKILPTVFRVDGAGNNDTSSLINIREVQRDVHLNSFAFSMPNPRSCSPRMSVRVLDGTCQIYVDNRNLYQEYAILSSMELNKRSSEMHANFAYVYVSSAM